MAVTKEMLSNSLVMKYQTGLDEQGAPIVKSKTYSGLSVSATDQKIYDNAMQLQTLAQDTLVGVETLERNDLVDY